MFDSGRIVAWTETAGYHAVIDASRMDEGDRSAVHSKRLSTAKVKADPNGKPGWLLPQISYEYQISMTRV